ncbi:hypothetical protein NHX12_015971 [Muraenolepis orangiensis]|uniref:Uncharacterized protein n=1 Tax=Muraenolepis orangiensis TaxID=630683 RepID=A0A9Q0D8H9_9TELE|nr:hypothetical protein NHX12_015971 [Muraenolepis orangiensis]
MVEEGLFKGAVWKLFEWNGYFVEIPQRSVWERTERPIEPVPSEEQEQHIDGTKDHDYCSVPQPSALDMAASTAEDLSKKVEESEKGNTGVTCPEEFGLQRFAGSDTDIQ